MAAYKLPPELLALAEPIPVVVPPVIPTPPITVEAPIPTPPLAPTLTELPAAPIYPLPVTPHADVPPPLYAIQPLPSLSELKLEEGHHDGAVLTGYRFETPQHFQPSLTNALKQLYPLMRVNHFTDCTKYTLLFDKGRAIMTVKLSADDPHHPLDTFVEWKPRTASVYHMADVNEFRRTVLDLGAECAIYMATGASHADTTRFLRKRIGRPVKDRVVTNEAKELFSGMAETAGIPVPDVKAVDTRNVVAQRRTTIGANGFDLTFVPLQPEECPWSVAGGWFRLVALTDRGARRVRQEKELGYPPYRYDDLIAALYHLEGLNLSTYVAAILPGHAPGLTSGEVKKTVEATPTERPLAANAEATAGADGFSAACWGTPLTRPLVLPSPPPYTLESWLAQDLSYVDDAPSSACSS